MAAEMAGMTDEAEVVGALGAGSSDGRKGVLRVRPKGRVAGGGVGGLSPGGLGRWVRLARLRALCGRPGRRNTLPGPFRTDDTGAMSSDRVIGRCWSSCGYVACRSDRQGKAQSSARVTDFAVSPERAQTASAVQHLSR